VVPRGRMLGALVAMVVAVSACSAGPPLSATIPRTLPCQLLAEKYGTDLAGTSESKTVAFNGPTGGYTCKYDNGENGRLSLTVAPAPRVVSEATWEKLFTRTVGLVDGHHGQDNSHHYVHEISALGYWALLSYQKIHGGGVSCTIVSVMWVQGRVSMRLEASSLVTDVDGNPATGGQVLAVAHAIARACQDALCHARPQP
jgi:hypothetical protein